MPKSYTTVLLILLLTITHSAWTLENPWSQVTTPAPGLAQSIGSYSAGCIQGAVNLLPDAKDFEIMRPSRRRYFAHPQLRNFVLWFAKAIRDNGYGKLLVGDLGQARGGPTTTGHASHQIGLDADFWFWLESGTKGKLTKHDKEHFSAPSMLNAAQTKINNARFGEAQIRALELAARHPQVERIFVNPIIKQAACRQTQAASWLHKVRPWWGHHYHFHVRLGCPTNQPYCKAQEPIPKTDGCGAELEEWFHPKANETENKQERKLTPEQRLAIKLNRLPKECAAVLRSSEVDN